MRANVLAVGFVVVALGAGGSFRAQDAARESALQQKALAQASEDQRKAMELQKKALEEQKRAREDQEKELRKQVLVLERRARLGIVLRTDKDAGTDAKGAYVEAVTPGGPAAEAGLEAGDIITRFNGEPLPGKYPGADEDESEPAVKLMDMARRLKSGDKVTLDCLRGKENRQVTLTARELGPAAWTGTIPDLPSLPDLSGLYDGEFDLSEIPELEWLGRAEGWLDMEMAPMNPDLAAYFGTDQGVLVIRAPADSPLKLKGGDVIMKIGDRTPKSGSQVIRILRSYEPGDTVNLEVMRKQKKTAVSFQIPKDEHRTLERRRESPPAVPAPPVPPAPPARAPGATTGT